jgi:hypothetical protein
MTIYTIGFGLIENCNKSDALLREIANSSGSSYYHSSNVTELESIYKKISEEIVKLSYNEQTAKALGPIYTTELYPDSYIEFNFSYMDPIFGIVLTFEEKFDNSSSLIFNIPNNYSILESRAVSYSGQRWTDSIILNGHVEYNLSTFGNYFNVLGDPYMYTLDKNYFNSSNFISVRTAHEYNNLTSGSSYNKVIYSLIRELISYSEISPIAMGCQWNIQYYDNTFENLKVPQNYFGTDRCYFNQSSQEYNENDAVQTSSFKLLQLLDVNSDGKVDYKFSEGNLIIESSQIEDIPYTWSTEVQARVWR